MKLHFFEQIVELNHSFDEIIAGLAKLESIPFFQREMIRHARSDVEIARVYANRGFSTTLRRSSRGTPNGPIGSSVISTKSSRTETTFTSKSGVRNRGGSGKDCPQESSSFPIGIGLTKTIMTKNIRC